MMQCALDGQHTPHEKWTGAEGNPTAPIIYELQTVGPQRAVPTGVKVHRCTYCGALFAAHPKLKDSPR